MSLQQNDIYNGNLCQRWEEAVLEGKWNIAHDIEVQLMHSGLTELGLELKNRREDYTSNHTQAV